MSGKANEMPVNPQEPGEVEAIGKHCDLPECHLLDFLPFKLNCTTCRKQYCLSHRLQDQHDCDKVKPPPPAAATANEKAKAALSRFKAWTSSKSDKVIQSTRPGASQIAELNKLKRAAKGDDKVPVGKRVYVYVEAEARTTTSKLPRGEFYYSNEWTVGRVANLNNKADDDEKKLRVFHVEGGRVLSFGEKIGDAVGNGNTIVLLRGLQMPELME
ncbi:hypothetical protein B9Z19DRAFT_19986 [Tuber borchii]|uniref:AN1-type domain-containing protein n=1 Tax=Tuber borchii TaxID=42251 RepID=A0A2T6ZUF6_TUBBO|nr:hypothetical protein B9Z19DRAFT_19986 [Tuber borchii]